MGHGSVKTRLEMTPLREAVKEWAAAQEPKAEYFLNDIENEIKESYRQKLKDMGWDNRKASMHIKCKFRIKSQRTSAVTKIVANIMRTTDWSCIIKRQRHCWVNGSDEQ